jgi:hypothetical protein
MVSRKNKEILSIAVLVQTADGQFHRVALNHSDYFDLVELLRSLGDDLHLDDEELRNFTFDAPSLKKPFPLVH